MTARCGYQFENGELVIEDDEEGVCSVDTKSLLYEVKDMLDTSLENMEMTEEDIYDWAVWYRNQQ